MRIGLEAFGGFLNAHQGQQLQDALARRFAAQAPVQHQGFTDLLLDAVQRVQRGHRLLEDHRDPVATQLPQGRGIGAQQFLAAVANAAGGAGFCLGQQLQDRVGRH